MNFHETMTQLKNLGTAQNVKVYKRHGACDPLFGVSYANLGKLQKRIKINHELADRLWETGNLDAQVLATKIADPAKLTVTQANQWVKAVNCYITADALGALVAQSPIAKGRMEQWMKSKSEFVRQVGYVTLSASLGTDNDISDTECRKYLKTIEKEIHRSPNRARHSMNMALIAIGIYRPSLRDQTIAAAERIGTVEVDHGETSCTTPPAIPYIQKAVARQTKKKAAKR